MDWFALCIEHGRIGRNLRSSLYTNKKARAKRSGIFFASVARGILLRMDNPDRVTYFAASDSRGQKVPFGIKRKDRSRHMYVIGKTGMGKSTLLENMAIQDMRNGEGLAFIDPHGATADKLLEYIPENRLKDVVYFAPFDLENPIAFNVMEDVGYDKRHLVVSGLMATFKKVWIDAWSARMEYILSNTLLALLEYPDATLLSVNRMYTDKAFRKLVVDNIKDPVVKDFWVKEFATYTDRYTQEATPAIQNKVGQFTSNPLIRNIIGQPRSSFDIRTMMDQKKILIINLSKGLVGEVNMRLLGSMLTTRIFLAAMSRADLSSSGIEAAPNFYLYVDEFQNFANETFAEVLSEARKYKLNLIITHQYVEQMEEEVRDAVFGNVGTTVAFRVGPFDAETLEPMFAPEFTPEDLVNLGFAQVYLTLMIDGVGSRPFSAVTLPPIAPPARSYKEEVIASSRKNFAVPRASIESAIIADLAKTEGLNPPPEPPKNNYRKGPGGNGGGGYAGERRPPAPRPPAPRAETPHVEPRSEPRPLPPPPPEKTGEDLRSILKAMTEKATSEKEKKQEKAHISLSGALQTVIPTSDAPVKHTSPSPPKPPRSEPVKNAPPVAPVKKAFEVPEEELRALFRNDT